jgi:hypothetical protein
MSEEKQKFIGIFWSQGFDGWIEVKRIFVCATKEEAQKRATEIEEKNPGTVKFVGWEGEVIP